MIKFGKLCRPSNNRRWNGSTRGDFPALMEAIAAARKSIQMETYIYEDSKLGRQYLSGERLIVAQFQQVTMLRVNLRLTTEIRQPANGDNQPQKAKAATGGRVAGCPARNLFHCANQTQVKV